MDYITHPFICPDRVEKRDYQFNIAMQALETNTLVVIPTGLGKTAISLIVAASRLYAHGGKILMMAPTKPLVEQHVSYFKHNMDPNHSFVMLTGETSAKKRKEQWETGHVIFATPQVIKNDIIAGKYTLSDVTLLIIDEAHRAVGNYSYVFIATRYMETANDPLILAMTASPGSSQEKIADIIDNLHIKHFETRNETDSDVAPYIHDKEIEYLYVNLPDDLRASLNVLNNLVDDRISILKEAGYFFSGSSLSMKVMKELNVQIQEKIAQKDAEGFTGASIFAECMKLRHAISLAGTQGSLVLKRYLDKLLAEGRSGGSKAAQRLSQDESFQGLIEVSNEWNEEFHPKMLLLPSLIDEIIMENPDTGIIIFASYRDTVQIIVDTLNGHGISAERFVGQAKKDMEKGLSQKEQIETIRRFKEREFKVLVATSVGEEGLDIPATDVIIFYEPVPSGIRSIQRKGRTGRHNTGRIIVLVTKKTNDEAALYVSKSREKGMGREMRKVITRDKHVQQVLSNARIEDSPAPESLFDGPVITVDDRELNSRVVEELSSAGAAIKIERLLYGDYITGRVVAERKTSRDFVDSLIDRNLLDQIRLMSMNAEKPVLIIEGGSIYSERDIHPNAIRGTLAAISVNFGVPVFFTADTSETAEFLMVLARRESDQKPHERGPSKGSYESIATSLEAIVAAYPDIGLKYARLLLKEFGSVEAIVNAGISDLINVEGIGEKKAKRIYSLSRQQYPD